MKVKLFAVSLLTSLLVMGFIVNISAVEEADSPIESFWRSIPDQYKTKLKVYNEEGVILYLIELVLANETTLGKDTANIIPFIVGIKAEKIPQSAFLLYYIYKPEGAASGGNFNPSDLIITIPNEHPRKIYMGKDDIIGYLIRQVKNLDYGVSVYETMTGVFILERAEKNKLKEAKDKGKKVFVYYKGGGPRVELKLPGEI